MSNVPKRIGPMRPRAPRDECEFYVTINISVTMKKSELWPDGDGPEDPSDADVLALINDEGGPIGILREWNLEEDAVLHVRKVESK